MKNKQIINTMEEFMNMEEEQKIPSYISSLNNKQVIEYANGNWTTNETVMISDLPTNLMTININNNERGTVKINNILYKINNILNGSIYTETKNGINYQIYFEELDNVNLRDNNNIINIPPNQPRGTLFTNDVNNQVSPYITFKLPLTEEAKLALQNNFTQIKQEGYLYDKDIYEIITKKYKFSTDAITIDNSNKMNISPAKLRILKLKYNGSYIFQLQHIFTFPNNQKVFSKLSPLYEFKVLDKNNQVAEFLKFKPLENELAENKLLNKFSNVKTFIYFYKSNKFSDSYDFLKPDIKFNKNQLRLKNNAGSFFNNIISAPDLNSVAYIKNSNLKATVFDTITSDLSKNTSNENENLPRNINLRMINRFLN